MYMYPEPSMPRAPTVSWAQVHYQLYSSFRPDSSKELYMTALFSFINYRLLHMPTTIGVMFIALATSWA